MERKVAVVTDSTAYLPAELAKEYEIRIVPLYLIMGDQSWLDGVDIEPPAFYELLKTSPDFPTTSQPNAAAFQELFVSLFQEGVEGIVCVLISSDISGTVASAQAAAANLPDLPVEIIDTRLTAMAQGFVALAAARAAAAGGGMQAVSYAARQVLKTAHVYFIVDTLEYLHRGGRIGAAAKFLGSVLNLKPILELRDGIVQPVTKVRTRRKALEKVYELLAARFPGGDQIHMAVFHVAAREEAARVARQLETRFHPVELMIAECSPVIGAHAGPGTVGVAFYNEIDLTLDSSDV